MATTRERLPGTQTPPGPGPAIPKDEPDHPHTAPTAAPPGTSPEHESAEPHPNWPHPRARGKSRRLLLLVPILILVGGIALIFGYRYWYDSTYFVATDNASVTGDLVQIGSLNAGRIVATRVDVGDRVAKGQEIAVVAQPQQVGAAVNGPPRMDIVGTADTLVSVSAQMDGVVAARTGFIGGTVAAGQPIYSLVDPGQTWVRANIDETSIWRVAVGQPAEIHVDALNRDFTGRVEAITPASSATFSLLPSGNVSGNFIKVTQYVPIKIAVDAGGMMLPLGTSVEIRVRVREPGSAIPLPWQP